MLHGCSPPVCGSPPPEGSCVTSSLPGRLWGGLVVCPLGNCLSAGAPVLGSQPLHALPLKARIPLPLTGGFLGVRLPQPAKEASEDWGLGTGPGALAFFFFFSFLSSWESSSGSVYNSGIFHSMFNSYIILYLNGNLWKFFLQGEVLK